MARPAVGPLQQRCGPFGSGLLRLGRLYLLALANRSVGAFGFSNNMRPVLIGRLFVSTITTNLYILMAKTLQIRIEEDLRTEADGVLREIGLDVPSAVRLFLTKVVQTRSIPFELKASGMRVVELAVDPDIHARMDEIGTLWAKKKLERE